MACCNAYGVVTWEQIILLQRMINKLRNSIGKAGMLLLFFSTGNSVQVKAQNESSFTRPPVTDKWKDYTVQVKLDSTKKMVELRSLIPSIVYDLRYATRNNFMHRLMYPVGTQQTFLRLPAANALKKVQEELNKSGLGLKIFDAYRPYAVTVKFWELVK